MQSHLRSIKLTSDMRSISDLRWKIFTDNLTAMQFPETKVSLSPSHLAGSTTWKVLYQALCNWLVFGDQMKHPSLDGLFLKPGEEKHFHKIKTKWLGICSMHGYLSTSWVDMECYGKSRATQDNAWQSGYTIMKAKLGLQQARHIYDG